MRSGNFSDDENTRILNGLREKGVDLSVPHALDFSLLFEDVGNATRFVDVATALGFICRLAESDIADGPDWDVTATQVMVPTTTAVNRAERRLAELAAPLGGEMDGWGFLAVPPRAGRI